MTSFSDLPMRILGGCLFLLIVLPAFLWGGIVLLFLCLSVGLLAYREWWKLIVKGLERRGGAVNHALCKTLLFWQGGFLFLGLFSLASPGNILPHNEPSIWMLIESTGAVLGIIGSFLWFVYRDKGFWWMSGVPGWITLSLLLMAYLGMDGGSTGPILILASVVMMADILAYFSGRFWGGPRLGSVSPKKTISGVCGSLLGGILCGGLWFIFAHVSWSILLFAPLIALLSVVGDILCSASKRWSGQKDMSTLLPGHGGILDRWDGFLFIVPFGSLWVLFDYL